MALIRHRRDITPSSIDAGMVRGRLSELGVSARTMFLRPPFLPRTRFTFLPIQFSESFGGRDGHIIQVDDHAAVLVALHRGGDFEHLTQRCSAADLPAVMAMMRATRPSSPEQGDGLSFTKASTNAKVSCLYASL